MPLCWNWTSNASPLSPHYVHMSLCELLVESMLWNPHIHYDFIMSKILSPIFQQLLSCCPSLKAWVVNATNYQRCYRYHNPLTISLCNKYLIWVEELAIEKPMWMLGFGFAQMLVSASSPSSSLQVRQSMFCQKT